MIVAWCAVALALVGTDDAQATTAKPPGSSFTNKIEFGGGNPAQPLKLPKVTISASAAADASAACCATNESKPAGASEKAACTQPEPAATSDAIEQQEVWPMTLRDALAIALDNSEILRVISFGERGFRTGGNCFGSPPPNPQPPIVHGAKVDSQSFVIARLNADAAAWRFKSEVMAIVRSVEQTYWNLAQAHTARWAADRAVNMAKDVVARETAELEAMPLCRGSNVADVAEANDRLEQFNRDLVTRTSDVITAERQFRKILGLPEADNRRIIPVTSPTKERVTFDWDKCLAELMDKHPDVVQQKILVKLAELQLLIASNPSLPRLNVYAFGQFNALCEDLENIDEPPITTYHKFVEPMLATMHAAPGNTSNSKVPEGAVEPPLRLNATADPKQAEAALERSNAFLKQLVHQTTHSLARSSSKSTRASSSTARPSVCAWPPRSGSKPNEPLMRKAGSRPIGSLMPSASTPRRLPPSTSAS